MNEPLPIVVVAARLRAAVEETAAALAGADLQRLLASDVLLQKVLDEIPALAARSGGPSQRGAAGATRLTVEERRLLHRETDDAQAALRRCRRLGTALTQFVRVSLDAQGQGLGYPSTRFAPAGQPDLAGPAAAFTGRGLNARA
jgi:hypothetical protein